jgi:hypothetical protein
MEEDDTAALRRNRLDLRVADSQQVEPPFWVRLEPRRLKY